MSVWAGGLRTSPNVARKHGGFGRGRLQDRPEAERTSTIRPKTTKWVAIYALSNGRGLHLALVTPKPEPKELRGRASLPTFPDWKGRRGVVPWGRSRVDEPCKASARSSWMAPSRRWCAKAPCPEGAESAVRLLRIEPGMGHNVLRSGCLSFWAARGRTALRSLLRRSWPSAAGQAQHLLREPSTPHFATSQATPGSVGARLTRMVGSG
jgi:hypothetical protein